MNTTVERTYLRYMTPLPESTARSDQLGPPLLFRVVSRKASTEEQSLHSLLGASSEAFGNGKPTPGSGSLVAAAGVMATDSLRSVLKYTEKKIAASPGSHRSIAPRLGELAALLARGRSQLADLALRDSEAYSRYREEKAYSESSRGEFGNRAQRGGDEGQKLLELATLIPVEIAELCIRLSDCGMDLLHNGYQEASGQSEAAVDILLTSAHGALAVATRNCLTLGSRPFAIEIKKRILEALQAWSSGESEFQCILEELVGRRF